MGALSECLSLPSGSITNFLLHFFRRFDYSTGFIGPQWVGSPQNILNCISKRGALLPFYLGKLSLISDSRITLGFRPSAHLANGFLRRCFRSGSAPRASAAFAGRPAQLDCPSASAFIVDREAESGWIRGVEGAAPRVIIRLFGGGDQGIAREELLGSGVVVAGAQVVQPALGVLVLPGVAERVGDAARARGGAAVGEYLDEAWS